MKLDGEDVFYLVSFIVAAVILVGFIVLVYT